MDLESILQKAANLKAAHKPFALVTVVRAESPTSAKPGAKAIVEPEGEIQGWIGGGCAQPAVLKTARDALKDGQPRLIRISPAHQDTQSSGIIDFTSSCYSGGTLDIFIEPIIEQTSLLIIGASPVAEALCALASRVGFSVMVMTGNIKPEQFPDAEQIIPDREFQKNKLTGLTFIVVATQGQRDETGLVAALETGASYITFIASTRKAAKLREKLIKRGHNQEKVNAIVAPAGMEINAVTPEEIALSVLASLVKHKRKDRKNNKEEPVKISSIAMGLSD